MFIWGYSVKVHPTVAEKAWRQEHEVFGPICSSELRKLTAGIQPAFSSFLRVVSRTSAHNTVSLIFGAGLPNAATFI